MQAGEIIQEKYELIEQIGTGGMAVVWRADDTHLGRPVAIKFLASRLCEDPEFLVRFFSEAQSAASISHPGIVAILDFGQTGSAPYLVMELAEGGSVADLAGKPLPVDRVIEIIGQAARGAGAAHERDLIHRDIKPANILLDAEGNAKLADFGIASRSGSEDLTATGTTIGSPHYISPEQVSGQAATSASDVYALGVVAYELLTGRPPFVASNITAIAIAHVDREPESPSALREGLDPAFEAVIMRCLAKDPDERFADGNELARAVEPFSAASSETAVAPGSATATVATVYQEPAPVARRRILVAALALTTGLLLTTASVMLLGGRDEVPTATTATEDEKERRKRKGNKPTAEATPTQDAAAAPAPSPTPSPDEKEADAGKTEPAKPDRKPGSGSGGGGGDPEPEPEPEPEPTPSAAPPSPQTTPGSTEQAVQRSNGSS